jgi:hypothetical protein
VDAIEETRLTGVNRGGRDLVTAAVGEADVFVADSAGLIWQVALP